MNEVALKLLEGPFSPWMPAFVLAILFGTAAWDARTGIVPNIPLLVGAVAVAITRFVFEEWNVAVLYIGMGLAAWAGVWALNEIWFRVFGKDAVGMGDAKWTALAVATFGPVAGALFAWFAGSWVSIAWIIGSYAVGIRIKKVYFAPFLFCGLVIGLLITKRVVELPFPLGF